MPINRTHIMCWIFAICLVISGFFIPTIYAAEMSAQVLPNRVKVASNPLPILITFTPVSTASETSIKITVPSEWQMSPSPSSYTVSSTGLPAGVIAAPGISTATQKSGLTLTFPISDLSAGTKYGFYINGGITQTSSSISGAEQLWSIVTFDGSTPIDSQELASPIVANDQIVVTASVLPASTDLTTSITASPSGSITQNDTISYTLTYESLYSSSTPVTLVASWESESSGNPVDLMNYVMGSASEAYGGTTPIIDTIAKSITWTISSIPSGAGPQTVTFQLKAAELALQSNATITVSSQITAPVSTVPSSVSSTYSYTPPAPSPSPTPIATTSPSTTTSTKIACNETCTNDSECDTNYCYLGIHRCRSLNSVGDATCGGTITAPETPSLAYLQTKVISITNSSVSMLVQLSKPATLQISYWTENKVASLVSLNTTTDIHEITLSSLNPDTTYYFTTLAKAGDETIKSEVFSFHTAKSATAELVSFSIHSGSTQLLDSSMALENRLLFSAPAGLLSTRLVFSETVTSAAIHLSPLQTWPQFAAFTATGHVLNKTVHISNQIPPEGVYRMELEFTDQAGSKQTITLAFIHTVPALTILDAQTNIPLDAARLQLYVYNPTTRLFEFIIPNTLLASNPIFTQSDGTAPLILPMGRYRADASLLGFSSNSQEFLVDPSNKNPYPTIKLSPDRFGFISSIQHWWTVSNSIADGYLSVLKESMSSYRFMQGTWTFAGASLTLAIIASALHAFGSASNIFQILKNISPFLFPLGINRKSLQIRLIDEHTHIGIGASVAILTKNGNVLKEITTTKSGYATIPRSNEQTTILITADGYHPLELSLHQITNKKIAVVELEKHTSENEYIISKTTHTILGVFKEMFEIFLALSIFSSLAGMLIFSFWPSIILLVINTLTAIIWYSYKSTHSEIDHSSKIL